MHYQWLTVHPEVTTVWIIPLRHHSIHLYYQRVKQRFKINRVKDKKSESYNKERSIVLFVSGKQQAAPVSRAVIERSMINEVVTRQKDPYVSASSPVPQWPPVAGLSALRQTLLAITTVFDSCC